MLRVAGCALQVTSCALRGDVQIDRIFRIANPVTRNASYRPGMLNPPVNLPISELTISWALARASLTAAIIRS